ncbi:SDR family oxidoreductase [Streptomyces sp. NPDC012510]|jgi:NAD(P)-dependent dehydrogenase (short-subunit alcohol dehydrogenase family)|uniref:SDR family oxidoreductase n=1 Tax=Streptomyces sp. NPDC012510 TaxID=3364838 RepID=UPI0036ED66A0
MKTVVHRRVRTREIESRVAEAPALAKEWGGPAPVKEWDGRGVDVNPIARGCIATDNPEALRADPRRSQAILARIPAGRWRRADDLAGATVFVASPASDCANGIVLPVDGGRLGR